MAVNCPVDTQCDIVPVGVALEITTGISSSLAQRVNALDTAQRALEVFGSVLDGAGVIEMRFPCTDEMGCGGHASSPSQDEIRVTGTTGAMNGRSVAHELGHVVHKQQFGQDTFSFDKSLNGPNHNRFDTEYESSATVEGWADFVAAASWWDDDNSGSEPMVAGEAVEEAEAHLNHSCLANRGIGFQVTKGFWDLADSNNESAVFPANSLYPDSFNTTPAHLALGWSAFAAGTSNREQDEVDGGSGDPNGLNLRDYYSNNTGQGGFGAGFEGSLLYHNCTINQDNG